MRNVCPFDPGKLKAGWDVASSEPDTLIPDRSIPTKCWQRIVLFRSGTTDHPPLKRIKNPRIADSRPGATLRQNPTELLVTC
jgi:hypothetical protein